MTIVDEISVLSQKVLILLSVTLLLVCAKVIPVGARDLIWKNGRLTDNHTPCSFVYTDTNDPQLNQDGTYNVQTGGSYDSILFGHTISIAVPVGQYREGICLGYDTAPGETDPSPGYLEIFSVNAEDFALLDSIGIAANDSTVEVYGPVRVTFHQNASRALASFRVGGRRADADGKAELRLSRGAQIVKGNIWLVGNENSIARIVIGGRDKWHNPYPPASVTGHDVNISGRSIIPHAESDQSAPGIREIVFDHNDNTGEYKFIAPMHGDMSVKVLAGKTKLIRPDGKYSRNYYTGGTVVKCGGAIFEDYCAVLEGGAFNNAGSFGYQSSFGTGPIKIGKMGLVIVHVSEEEAASSLRIGIEGIPEPGSERYGTFRKTGTGVLYITRPVTGNVRLEVTESLLQLSLTRSSENDYTGGSHVWPNAILRGRAHDFGTGDIDLEGLLAVQNRSDSATVFPNKVSGIGRLKKEGRGRIRFDGEISVQEFWVAEGEAALSNPITITTPLKISPGGVLNLLGKSMTFNGLTSATEETQRTEPPSIVGGGDAEKQVVLTIFTAEDERYSFLNGAISEIDKLVKDGEGVQELFETIYTGREVEILNGLLEVTQGTFSEANIDINANGLLIVRHTGDQRVKFVNDVFGESRLEIINHGVMELHGNFGIKQINLNSDPDASVELHGNFSSLKDIVVDFGHALIKKTAVLPEEDMGLILGSYDFAIFDTPNPDYPDPDLAVIVNLDGRSITVRDFVARAGTIIGSSNPNDKVTLTVKNYNNIVYGAHALFRLDKIIKLGPGSAILIRERAPWRFFYGSEIDIRTGPLFIHGHLEEAIGDAIVRVHQGGSVNLSSDDDDNEVVFDNDVIGDGNLQAYGPNVIILNAQLPSGEVQIREVIRLGEKGVIPAEAVLRVVGSDTVFDLGGRSKLVIGGLVGPSGKVMDTDELVIDVAEGLKYTFEGRIEGVRVLVKDGPGVQELFGNSSSASSDENSDEPDTGDPDTDESKNIDRVEVRGGGLRIRPNSFDEDMPIEVIKGAKLLVVYSGNDDLEGHFFDITGAGETHLVAETEEPEVLNLPEDMPEGILYIPGGEVDLGESDRTFFGLLGSDVSSRVFSLGDNTLTLQVPAGKEYIFDGVFGVANTRKTDPGTQIIRIDDRYSGEIQVGGGGLILKFQRQDGVDYESNPVCGSSEICVKDTRLEIEAGAKVVLSTQDEAVGFVSVLSGDGDVSITGSDRMLLIADGYDFTGAITVKGMTVFVKPADNAIDDTVSGGSFVVEEGGILRGVGRINGMITVKSGATLAPGMSVGRMWSGGRLLETNSTYQLDVEIDDDGWRASVTEAGEKGITIETGTILKLVLSSEDDNGADTEETDTEETDTEETDTEETDTEETDTEETDTEETDTEGNEENSDIRAFEQPSKQVIFRGYKTGRFGRIDSSAFETVFPVLSYDTATEEVSMTWKPFQKDRFASAGTESDQSLTVGSYIDRLGPTSRIYQVFAAVPESSVSTALKLVSGEIYGTVIEGFLTGSRSITDMISEYTHEAGFAHRSSVTVSRGRSIYSEDGKISAWKRGFGSLGEISDTESGSSTLSTSDYGILVGGDVMFTPDALAGAIVGYTRSAYEISPDAGKSEKVTNGYYLGGYGIQYFDGWVIRSSLVLGAQYILMSREISIPGIDVSETNKANHGVYGARLGFELAKYGFDFSSNLRSVIGGFLRLDGSYVLAEAFSEERGGSFALAGPGGSRFVLDASLGVRGSTCLSSRCDDSGSMSVFLDYGVGWRRYVWRNTDDTYLLNFVDAASRYSVSAGSVGRDVVSLRAGTRVQMNGYLSFSASYIGEISSTSHSNGFQFGGRLEF